MNTLSSLLKFIGERIQRYDSQLYPVGSYYWTSDSNFNPATTFGGTWEKLDEGVVLVSAGTNYPISSGTAKDGGEARHTLTVSEMPNHNHIYSDISVLYWGTSSSGAVTLNSNGGWRYNTPLSGAIGAVGGSQSHNIMQPYKNAYCWHRTA